MMNRGVPEEELYTYSEKDKYPEKLLQQFLKERFGKSHGLQLIKFVEAFRYDQGLRFSTLQNRVGALQCSCEKEIGSSVHFLSLDGRRFSRATVEILRKRNEKHLYYDYDNEVPQTKIERKKLDLKNEADCEKKKNLIVKNVTEYKLLKS